MTMASEVAQSAPNGTAPGPVAGRGARPRPPNARPNPMQEAYEQKMGDIDRRIETLRAKLDDMRGGGSGNVSGVSAGDKSARGQLLDEVRKAREQQRALEDERRQLIRQLNDARDMLKKKAGDVTAAKDKLPFKTVPEIEKRIKELESQLENGTFKLSEEKQIVGDISKLKKARKTLESIDGSGSDVGSLRVRIEHIRGRLTEKEAAIETVRTEVDRLSGRINEMDGKKADDKASRVNRGEQMAKLKKDLDDAYSARKSAFEEHKAARKAQFEARQRRDARRAEANRRQEIEQRMEELEEKLLGHNPESMVDKKWSECNNLATFFQQFLPSAQKPVGNAPTKLNGNPTLAAPIGREAKLSEELAEAEVLTKKSDREEVFYLAPTKKSGHKPSSQQSQAAPTNTSLGKLPLHILAGLADMNMPIPSSTEHVSSLLESIEKRKAEFKAKRDESAHEVDSKREELKKQLEELKLQLEKPKSSEANNKEPADPAEQPAEEQKAEAEDQPNN